MELVGITFGEMLLEIVYAGRLGEHQHTAAKATAHHPRADHLGRPGGELHEAVKLPAAYREIESKALMRCVEEGPEAAGRAPAKRVGRLQDARILRDHMPGTVSLNGIAYSFQVGFRGVSKAREAQCAGGRLALHPALVVRRAGQLVTHPAVGEQPGKAAIG